MIGDLISTLSDAQKLSIAQIQKAVQDGTLPAYVGIPLLQDKVKQRNEAAALLMGQKPKQPKVAEQVMAAADQAIGIPSLGGPAAPIAAGEQEEQAAPSEGVGSLESNLPQEYAGGGIIAFAEGGAAPELARSIPDAPGYFESGDIGDIQRSALTQEALEKEYLARLQGQRAMGAPSAENAYLQRLRGLTPSVSETPVAPEAPPASMMERMAASSAPIPAKVSPEMKALAESAKYTPPSAVETWKGPAVEGGEGISGLLGKAGTLTGKGLSVLGRAAGTYGMLTDPRLNAAVELSRLPFKHLAKPYLKRELGEYLTEQSKKEEPKKFSGEDGSLVGEGLALPQLQDVPGALSSWYQQTLKPKLTSMLPDSTPALPVKDQTQVQPKGPGPITDKSRPPIEKNVQMPGARPVARIQNIAQPTAAPATPESTISAAPPKEDTSMADEIARSRNERDSMLKMILGDQAADKKDAEENKWLSLAKAGFSIAGGRSPYAMVNIGEGMSGGIGDIMAAKEHARKEQQGKIQAAADYEAKSQQLENAMREMGIMQQHYKSMDPYYQEQAEYARQHARLAGAQADLYPQLTQAKIAKALSGGKQGGEGTYKVGEQTNAKLVERWRAAASNPLRDPELSRHLTPQDRLYLKDADTRNTPSGQTAMNKARQIADKLYKQDLMRTAKSKKFSSAEQVPGLFE